MKKVILLIVLILSGCESIPPPRPEYTNIPPLEKGWARLYFTAGKSMGSGTDPESIFSINLKYPHNIGPVYIDNLKVGSTAYLEHFAVDLLPGVYEVYWEATIATIFELGTTLTDKRTLNIKAGQIRYFACDWIVTSETPSFIFMLSDFDFGYDYKIISERSSFDSKSKLVSYFKYINSDEPSVSMPE